MTVNKSLKWNADKKCAKVWRFNISINTSTFICRQKMFLMWIPKNTFKSMKSQSLPPFF